MLLCSGAVFAIWVRVYPPPAAMGMQQILFGDAYHVLVRSLTWGLAAALIIAGIVFWSPDVRSWTGRLGVLVGNASYSIYLGSALVMEFGERGLQKLHHVDATGPLGLIALYQTVVVLMVVVSGWGSYQFVEWPLVRKLQGGYAEWTRHEVAAAARLERVPTGS